MHKFTRSFLTEWRKLQLPFAGATFVVAVSGGADSVSLALTLRELKERKKLDSRFVLAHFNHNLRGEESREDERFVKSFAENLQFELACGIQSAESKIENQEGNLEQNARIARYEFLRETAENLNAYAILTAHTANDQAETFLLNLVRGSGIEGLSGIKQKRKIEKNSDILLIRPLLNWAKREDTENFCRLNEIEFRYDSMNEDLAFKRVRIRKVLLPLLKDFNPKIVETLAKTAALLKIDFEELKENAKLKFKDFENRSFESEEFENKEIDNLPLKDLKDIFPSMRFRLLREWLEANRGNLRGLETKHFEAIEKLIFSRKSGKSVELPNGETVVKNGGELFYKKSEVEKS